MKTIPRRTLLILSTALATANPTHAAERLIQADLVYSGAFRLPAGGLRPDTFEYGGNAVTYNPAGDPGGPADGYLGSLYVSGHDRIVVDLPDGGKVAELSIPAPLIAADPAALGQAAFLQGFQDVTGGLFSGLDEIPRMALQYLDHTATGPRIHLAWGQHFQEPPHASHALFGTNLASPQVQGAWYVGSASLYSVNDYMLELPADWAGAHTAGRVLGTGRYRDGGWSGKGPALFAYVPWTSPSGTLPPAGTQLAATTLLLYESSEVDESPGHQALAGYQNADEWAGAAFVTQGTRSAVVVVGTKGTGAKHWYGWIHPGGPDLPCIETELLGQFTLCWTSAGPACPPADLTGCTGHSDYRGWWSSGFTSQMLFYDPADLAAVAAGTQPPWAPQPYAALDIEPHLFHNPSGVEADMLGTGVQRRFRIGSATYDRATARLYVLELFADEARPVVHVFTFRPRPHNDFDADVRSDLAVYHEASGLWYVRRSSDGVTTTRGYGGPGYVTVAGDYDGDGRSDEAVYHAASGLWFVRHSSTGATAATGFGGPGFTPVARDYDRDGRADLAVFHAATGLWYLRSSATGTVSSLGFGGPGYTPVPEDYDGDGRADLAVYHAATGLWFVRSSASGVTSSTGFGGPGYTPVPRDYDGDGQADLAVFHAASGLWFVRNSTTGATWALGYGGLGYTPVPMDYDGDRRADLAVYHAASGLWFVRQSSTGTTSTLAYGGAAFTPVTR